MLMLLLGMTGTLLAKDKPAKMADDKVFYVYANKSDKKNHYIPSGWMGSYKGIKFDDAWKVDCIDGPTCIKITYDPRNVQGDGWHGIYWQATPSNWGNKAGGYDMSGYKRITFWARSDQDNTTINEFKFGGISGEVSSDSGSASVGPITLTKDWKKYVIDVGSENMSHINGGFCYATADNVIPETGMSLYLDEIRYEK